MSNVVVGQRVRIGFTRTHVPSVGAAHMRAALTGAVGRVESINPLTRLVLVRVDAKPQPWLGNPSPGNRWLSAPPTSPLPMGDGGGRHEIDQPPHSPLARWYAMAYHKVMDSATTALVIERTATVTTRYSSHNDCTFVVIRGGKLAIHGSVDGRGVPEIWRVYLGDRDLGLRGAGELRRLLPGRGRKIAKVIRAMEAGRI